PMRVSAKENGSLLLGSFEIVTPRRSTTMTATTRHFETTASTSTLFVSFELGESSWTLAFATERVERPRKRTMGARDRVAGIREDWRKALQKQLGASRSWDGAALPKGLRDRLDQEWERLELLNRQIDALEATRRERIRAGSDEPVLGKVSQLLTLQGVGSNS